MRLNKAEIRREIEKIASSYTSDEIFSSPYFKDILQAIVTSACEPLRRIPNVESFCDQQSDFTACTEGTRVLINTMGPLIRERDSNWDKYVNIVGHAIHECGHVLFTDFIQMANMLNAWLDDEFGFYPEVPKVEGTDSERIAGYLDEHPNYRKILVNEMKNIQNIMEDVYIENRLFEKFDGVAILGLAKSREELWRIGPCEDEFYDSVLEGKISPLSCYSQLLLSKRTGYPLKEVDDLSEEQKEVKKLMDRYFDLTEEEIDRLKWESDGKERCRLFNRLLVKLQPLLPEPPDNEDMKDPNEEIRKMLEELMRELSKSQKKEEGEGDPSQAAQPEKSSFSQSAGTQEQPGTNTGSSNDYSESQAQEQINQSNQMAENAGMSAVPQGSSKPVESGSPDRNAAEQSRKQAQEGSSSAEACQHKFQEAVKNIARKEFEAEGEQQHSAQLQSEADGILKDIVRKGRGSCEYVSGYEVERIDVGTEQTATYNRVYESVAGVSKHLSKKLSNLLDDRETESVDSGYLMGQRFNARDVVRGDGKYFSRIHEPDGQIKVCFGILVDESGSMSGRKSLDARKATILLEDTLRKIDVPLTICGHTTVGNDVLIRNYVDFDTNDGKDRYRLAEIDGIANNIDGAAISYMGERLLKRPEEQKVLIVISDGMPCGPSFYSQDRDEDTAIAIKTYRKKGINIFGAVVDDWEDVSRLYGEEYSFECMDGEKLERQLIRLVKKYLKRNQ